MVELCGNGCLCVGVGVSWLIHSVTCVCLVVVSRDELRCRPSMFVRRCLSVSVTQCSC